MCGAVTAGVRLLPTCKHLAGQYSSCIGWQGLPLVLQYALHDADRQEAGGEGFQPHVGVCRCVPHGARWWEVQSSPATSYQLQPPKQLAWAVKIYVHIYYMASCPNLQQDGLTR